MVDGQEEQQNVPNTRGEGGTNMFIVKDLKKGNIDPKTLKLDMDLFASIQSLLDETKRMNDQNAVYLGLFGRYSQNMKEYMSIIEARISAIEQAIKMYYPAEHEILKKSIPVFDKDGL